MKSATIRVHSAVIRLKSALLSSLSAVLLILSFPKTDYWPLAWLGLVPLLVSLDGKSLRKAFGTAYLCGVIFFAGTLFWIGHVTVLGTLILILFLSLYFGLFGLGYALFQNEKPIIRLFVLPSLWTALEFMRGHFLTGFSWASLALSQYKNLYMIQIADITGMFGVSFLIVLVNVFFKEVIFRKIEAGLIGTTLVIFGFAFVYGQYRLAQSVPEPRVLAAVIQANTPQELKWHEPAWPRILKDYLTLTEQAALDKPDLIIWPETSFPGILWEDAEYFRKIEETAARIQIPILLGSVVNENEDYYNTAMLLSRQGKVVKRYDKLHLVMFGEYIPLRSIFPFLSQIVPIGDFTPGKDLTLFSLNEGSPKFSVLICFEDTVIGLARKFVNSGADLLVNITNDAWFKDTKEPFMHLQSSIFRAIESRRSLIRSANTGISCFIDPYGRVLKRVEDADGKPTYVSGYVLQSVPWNTEKTVYTKLGDFFTYLCFMCILWTILRKTKNQTSITKQ